MEENTTFSDKFAMAIQKDLTKILGEIGGLKSDVAELKTDVATLKIDVADIKETMATKEDIRVLRNEIFQEINGIRGRVDRAEEKVGITPAHA
jgi:archaellum component FlaC